MIRWVCTECGERFRVTLETRYLSTRQWMRCGCKERITSHNEGERLIRATEAEREQAGVKLPE